MSERMQLKEAGDEHVMQVKRATTETIENTEYVKFDDGAVDLLVPLSSVERQLERLGVGRIADMEGLAVKFSRSTKLSKYGKPFWNLDVATKAELKPKAPSKRLTGPASPELPADGPPAFHRDVPLPESEDGDLITPPEIGAILVQKREAIESAYRWAVDTAMRAQNDLYIGEIAPTAESVQAGAATLLIQAEKRGAI